MTMIDDDKDYRNPLLAPTPESLEGARAIVAGMSDEQIAALLAGMQAQDREAKGPPSCADA